MKRWISFRQLSWMVVVLMCCKSSLVAQVQIAPPPGAAVLQGDAPHLVLTGLLPGEQVTVHAFRQAAVYPATRSGADTPVLAHAYATFVADAHGRLDVDTAVPRSGTYAGADALGLLWSGVRMPLTGVAAEPVTQHLHLKDVNEIVLRVQRGGSGQKTGWDESHFLLSDGVARVRIQDVAVAGLNGAFAVPLEHMGASYPAILLLHGSEGGSRDSARALATRFAQLGYAAFAVNYFAWPAAGIPDVPQALVDIPIETLAAARRWLRGQPGVNAEHVAVWGVSKGAEFALVGAVTYPWIDRVVACVPSSYVWSGFGRPPAHGEVYSSWSIGGRGLPYIPYDNYGDVLQGRFSAAYVHQRSLRKATAAQKAAARIRVEDSDARFLLLAGAKDVVWPSAAMTEEVRSTLVGANRQSFLQTRTFPNASHYICGTGDEPRRINPVHKPEGDDPTPEADAHAAAAGWAATRTFLSRDTPPDPVARPGERH